MPYTRLKGLKENFYGQLEGESERLNCHLTPKDCETFYLQYGGESSNTVEESNDADIDKYYGTR